jgi:hypothetical protein
LTTPEGYIVAPARKVYLTEIVRGLNLRDGPLPANLMTDNRGWHNIYEIITLIQSIDIHPTWLHAHATYFLYRLDVGLFSGCESNSRSCGGREPNPN